MHKLFLLLYLRRFPTEEELTKYIDKDQLPLEYGGVSENQLKVYIYFYIYISQLSLVRSNKCI
jgi:hypothetical protein